MSKRPFTGVSIKPESQIRWEISLVYRLITDREQLTIRRSWTQQLEWIFGWLAPPSTNAPAFPDWNTNCTWMKCLKCQQNCNRIQTLHLDACCNTVRSTTKCLIPPWIIHAIELVNRWSLLCNWKSPISCHDCATGLNILNIFNVFGNILMHRQRL